MLRPARLAWLAVLCSLVSADGMYGKNSPVLQVTAKNYDALIARSNHTSMVEFYAPWCGHCQNLKPAYEKAAKNLAGLAKVAAIDCDEESNKPLCGQMGVQGFPTLKIIKPGKKAGRPSVEDYKGARSAKAMVDAVVDKIPTHVKMLKDADLDAWLDDKSTAAKAIVFTDKGLISPLIKSVAIDFLGGVSVAQMRSKEKAAANTYGLSKFPAIVLIPGAGAEPITYDGEIKRDEIIKFISQVATPNPDPAPAKQKASPSKKTKSAKVSETKSCPFSEASEAHKSSDFADHMQAAGTTIVDDNDMPTESPLPIVEHDQKPVVLEDILPELPHLTTAAELGAACMQPQSGTCVLVLLPAPSGNEDEPLSASATAALAHFAEVAQRHKKKDTKLFPFYGIPASNEAAVRIRKALELRPLSELEVVALNMKRKWWRSYPSEKFDVDGAENFIDSIRLGDGSKQKLPTHLLTAKKPDVADGTQSELDPTTVVAEPAPAATPDVVVDEVSDSMPADAQPQSSAEPLKHNEL